MILNLFNFDQLAAISTALIIFISAIVLLYSKNYLRGDKRLPIFSLIIFLITASLIITVSADNIFVMSFFWMTSNLLLVALMIHKKSWKQALRSGILALKNFAIGAICLNVALYLLSHEASSNSIQQILGSDLISQKTLIAASILIFVAALTQCALYPFHSWLISSLNSPTSASAVMHAGLVNGGGIILARFSSLFFQVPNLMTVIFIVGIFSAIIGSLWKLIQSNVKSMLACSTMSQMGFMIAQCGMGLFPAAIAHLFWHGMFKSYLFLSSPSSAQEKRLNLCGAPKLSSFFLAIFCGFFGAAIFAKINEFGFQKSDTTLILVAVSFIAASQVALTIIGENPLKNFIPAVVLSVFLSAIYAISVMFVEKIMSFATFQPQPLNMWHMIALIILAAMWLAKLFLYDAKKESSQAFGKIYVKAINASQPKSETITSSRNQYNYR
jgi:NAD(P)H-quinone oxidoreductase subunit 5